MNREEILQTIRETLYGVRGRLEKRENWIKGTYATDKFGKSVDWWDKRAECFCLLGAIEREINDRKLNTLMVEIIFSKIRGVNNFMEGSITKMNDSDLTEHKDILSLLDKVIEGI